MSPKLFPTQISQAVIPVSAFGLFLSSSNAALAKADAGENLSRLTERHVRMQQRRDQRDQLRVQRDILRDADVAPAAAFKAVPALTGQQNNLAGLQNQNRNVNFRNANQNQLRERSQFLNAAGRFKGINRGVELDLTSDRHSIRLGSEIFGAENSVTISVGDKERTFTAGSLVTPAEYIALQQKLEDGSQELILDRGGSAVDGQVLLGTLSDAGEKIKASSLVVPVSVDAIGNFAERGDFRLKGDLINFGSVYALSNKAESGVASIGARNIANHEGALISSSVPSSVSSQFGNVNSTLDLKVSAEDRLVNLGTIESSGSLTVSAPNVNNSGVISATAGSVNFGEGVDAAITVDSSAGTVKALSGAINFRDSNFTAKFDTTVTGGDWLSKEFNVHGGEGNFNLNVGQLTGALTVRACTAHIATETENLNINGLITTGDPTITNALDVSINADITTGGAPLTIIAGRDVLVSAAVTQITTDVGAGAAGDILIVAGAAFENETDPDHLGQDWITGTSATGGNITFAGGTFVQARGNTGGDVQLVALPQGTNRGIISGPSGAAAVSEGASGGASGDVTLLGLQINISGVDTIGVTSAPGTGNVLLATGTPQISGPVVVDHGSGKVLSGSFSMPFTPNAGTSDNIQFNSANVGGQLAVQSSGKVLMNGPIVANSVVMTADDTITFGTNPTPSSIKAPGGVTMVTSGFIALGDLMGHSISTDTTSGPAGDVTLVAGAKFTQNATQITVTGGTAGGSTIDLSSNFTLSAKATNGAGGDITIVTFSSGTIGNGRFLLSGPVITAGGGGGGANGTVTIVAGETTTLGVNSITTPGIDVTGGLSGTGGIALSTSTPNTSTAVLINKSDGSIASGTFLGGALQAPGINAGTLTLDGGDLTVAGTKITGLPAFTGTLDAASIRSESNVTLAASLTAGSLDITTTKDISIAGATLTGAISLDSGTTIVSSAAISASNANFVAPSTISLQNLTLTGALNVDGAEFTAGAISGTNGTIIAAGKATFTSATMSGNLAVVADDTISFGGSLTAPGGILLVSGHDINASAAANLNAENTGGSGGNISIIAGAAFTQTPTEVTFTGPSVTGGQITFNSVTTISSRSTGGGGSGGEIQLIAFDGSDNTALITSTGGTIKTGGNGGGANGNVTVVAGKDTAGTAINFSGIDVKGGLKGTGNVNLYSATPSTTPSVKASTTTALITGSFIGGKQQIGDITVGTITMDGGDLNVDTGGTANITSYAGEISGLFQNVQGNFTVSSPITADRVAITATGNITLQQSITASGGILLIAGHNITTFVGAPIELNASKATGKGGTVSLVAGAKYTVAPALYTVSGASTTGGAIIFQNGDMKTVDARSTGGNGVGGNVNMIAFNGTDNSGSITSGFGNSILAGGNGTANNGNVLIVAGTNNTGTGIQLQTIDTTGGTGASGGGITLSTSTPNTSTALTFGKLTSNFANITAGNPLGGATTNATINTGTLAHTGAASVTAGRDINLGTVNGSGQSSLLATAANDLNQNGAIQVVKSASLLAKNNILLRDDLIAAGGISVVAGHNISTNIIKQFFIKTDSATGSAGDITMVAGADFTSTATDITIKGASSTGGIFNVLNQDVKGFSAKSTFANGDGGDVTLVAFSGSDSSGQVFTGNGFAALQTGGKGTGANGDVVLISGHNSAGSAISITGVDTTGGASGTGNIDLVVSTPNTTPNVVISRSTGTITTGNFLGGPTKSGSISTGTLAFAGSTARLSAGLDVTTNANATGALHVSAGQSISQNGEIKAGSVSLAAAKDIILRDDILATSGILVVAGRNIQSVLLSTQFDIRTETTGDAGDITMVAGAAFTESAGSITITGASSTGGFIQYQNQDVKSLSSRSTGGNGDGGDINLIAFNGTDNTGSVSTGTGFAAIQSGGNGSGTNGDVNIVAGHNGSSTAIGMTGVDTTGGAAGTGDINIVVSTPLTTPNVVLSKTTGGITSGSFLGGPSKAGSITTTGTLTFNGSDANLAAGLDVNIGGSNGTGSGAALTVSAGQNITQNGLLQANTIALLAKNNIQLREDIIAPGGLLIVAGHNIQTNIISQIAINTNSTGDAGDITMIAGANFTQNAGNVTVNGASATGGFIQFQNNDVNVMTAKSTGANGNGGDVNMIAFTGSDGSGTINTGGLPVIEAGGKGTGSNGSVTFVAGHNGGGQSISTGGANVTGGKAGTGSVHLETATPNVTPPVVISTTGGSLTTGDFTGGATKSGSIGAGTITVGGGTIDIISGTTVAIGTLDAGGGTTGNGGTINVVVNSGTPLTVGQNTGNHILQINANGGTTSGNAGSVDLTNLGTGGINLNNAPSLNLGVTNGNGANLGLHAPTGTVNINYSPINVSGAGPGPHNGGSIEIEANNITSPVNLQLIANGVNGGNGGSISVESNGNITVGTGNGEISTTANGPNSNINIDSGGVLTITKTGTITATTVTLTGDVGVTNNGTVTATGILDITTPYLTNTGNLTGGTINIQSPAGSGLTVDGGATGGTMTSTGPGGINITATNDDLTFVNDQTFKGGLVNWTAVGDPTSAVIISAGADLVGDGTINIFTRDFQNNGGTVTAPDVNIISPDRTTANNSGTGDVILTGDIVFVGSDVAIIASGDILFGTATSIDLSSPTGNGGTLTLLSGFNFTPATGKQVQDGTTTFTNFTANATGGDIDLTGVTIDLGSATGDGGNLLAVANGGTTNSGSVILASIDTTGGLNGGDVTVLAEGNVTVGDINTTGSKTSGSLALTSAAIQVIGTPQILNGVLSKGSFAPGTTGSGDITAGILNAGKADINIETNGGTITTNGALTANDLRLSAGSGTVDLGVLTNLTAQTDGTGNGGFITLLGNDIVFSSTSGAPLMLNADGTGSGNGGSIIYRSGSITATFVGVPTKTAKPPANFLSLSAQGGTTDGDGGSIEVEVGGNLFVDPAAAKAGIRAAAGSQDGAFYTFTAGTTGAKGGTLVISGNLVADGRGGGAGGQVDLESAFKKAFVVGSTKLPKNGVFGTLSAGPDGDIIVNNRLGGITVSSNAAVSGGLVDLTAAAKGKIAAGKGVTISAANLLSLTADLGAIGGKKALLVDAPVLALNGNSTVGVQNDFAGNKVLNNSSAGKGFTLTASGTGDLTLNDIVATGTVTVTGGTGGALNVNGDITAQDGGINLQNPDVNVGEINIASVDIHTAGQKGRDVVITIGAPPKDPTNTTPPANFAPPDLQDGGVVYFGPVGGVIGSPTVFTHAIGKDVIFNNASPTLTNTINIAGGADIEADPPVKVSQPRNSMFEAHAFGSMLNVATPVPLTQAVQPSPAKLMDAPIAPAMDGSLIQLTNGSLTQDLTSSQMASTTSGAIDLIAMQSGSVMALQASGTNAACDGEAAYGSPAQLSEDEQQALFDSIYTVDAFVWSDEDFGLKGGSVLPTDVRVANADTATLRTGHVLFAPQKDTSISTPFGTVEVAAGSMALVIANKNGLGIYDLHDSKKGAVRIKAGGHEFALSPGRCTHITSASTKQFHDINPLEAVGYRGLAERELQSGLKLYSSEFSTVHAVSAVRPLKQLVSANNAKARKLSTQMMKTSAVLMHLNAAGEYNFYQKPQIAAYNR